jgi:hypothetical protein
MWDTDSWGIFSRSLSLVAGVIWPVTESSSTLVTGTFSSSAAAPPATSTV